MQTSEGFYGSVLRDISEPDFRIEERHCVILRHFCLLQHLRTAAQVQRNIEFMTAMANAAFSGDPPPEYIPDAKATALMALRIFGQNTTIIDDLEVLLIENHSPIDFVTSDNPSVHTNRWHQQCPKAKGKAPGISSAGIAFFLPLTPRYLGLVYDSDVYAVERNERKVKVFKADDIARLNEHQYLNCQENVYFSDWSTYNAIEQAFREVAHRRPAKRMEVTTAVLEYEDDWGKKYKVVPQEQIRPGTDGIVHVREIPYVPSRWPRFLRLRNNPKIYSNDTGTGFVRAWSLERGNYSGNGYKRI
jgi:hypothetical protein